MRRSKYAVVLLCTSLAQVPAAEVSGRIIIDRSTNTKVVGPAVYDLRGIAVSNTLFKQKSSSEFDRVAVWLESKTSVTSPPATATMRQRDQRLEPALLVIPVGSTVDFPNLDPIFHNVFSLSRTQSFDLRYYSEGHSRSVKFARAGIVQVYCHVHPNMYGVIVVASSRWFGKPGPDGAFLWSDVPAGNYRLCVWQKSVGVVRRGILVPEAGSVHMNVAIPEEDPAN